MIDHLTVSVSDLAASRAFYEKVLAPLGYRVKQDYQVAIGFGGSGDDGPLAALWMKQAELVTTPQHIAFLAPSRAAVDAFHAVALQAGARDDGKPGIRAHYHANYYGAFVIDPLNGHPLEAVFHGAPAAKAKAKAKKTPGKATKAVSSSRRRSSAASRRRR